MIFHRLYHLVYGGECTHPERGDPSLMNLRGLTRFCKESGVTVLEKGYIDAPPWPDTVVTLKELFGSKTRQMTRVPFSEKMLFFEKATMKMARIFAHHIYVFGRAS
mgnify:CR=1 FL=1